MFTSRKNNKLAKSKVAQVVSREQSMMPTALWLGCAFPYLTTPEELTKIIFISKYFKNCVSEYIKGHDGLLKTATEFVNANRYYRSLDLLSGQLNQSAKNLGKLQRVFEDKAMKKKGKKLTAIRWSTYALSLLGIGGGATELALSWRLNNNLEDRIGSELAITCDTPSYLSNASNQTSVFDHCKSLVTETCNSLMIEEQHCDRNVCDSICAGYSSVKNQKDAGLVLVLLIPLLSAIIGVIASCNTKTKDFSDARFDDIFDKDDVTFINNLLGTKITHQSLDTVHTMVQQRRNEQRFNLVSSSEFKKLSESLAKLAQSKSKPLEHVITIPDEIKLTIKPGQ